MGRETDAIQPGNSLINNISAGMDEEVWVQGAEANALLIDNDTNATLPEHMLVAFDNTHAIALLADQPTTDTTKEFSISFWVNFKVVEAQTGYGHNGIVVIRTSDGRIDVTSPSGGSGYLRFIVGTGGGFAGVSTSTTGVAASGNLNKWWHITCVCFKDTDDSNKTKTKVYINGALEHTSTAFAGYDGGHTGADGLGGLIVGSFWDGDGTPPSGTKGFSGLISDLAIWNVALNDTDAKSLYNNGTNIILTHIPIAKTIYGKRNNILAYWRMGRSKMSALKMTAQFSGSTIPEAIAGYNGTMIEGTSHATTDGVYDNASGGAEATVQITTSNGVADSPTGVLAEGCTIKLTDATGKSITLEIDEDGGGVTSGNVQVDASALGAAASLAGTAIAIKTVIAAQKSAGNIGITATNPSGQHVLLVQDSAGSGGNTSIEMAGTGSNCRIRPNNDALYGNDDDHYPDGADSYIIFFGHGENGNGASNQGGTEARATAGYLGDDFIVNPTRAKYSGTTAFSSLNEIGAPTNPPKRIVAGVKGPAVLKGRKSAYKVSLGSGGSPSRENLEN